MKVTTDACLFGAWAAARYRITEMAGISGTPMQKKMLDIGTGTGLLSLMLTQQFPGLESCALEIDPAAAEEARSNISESPWPGQIRVINADARHFTGEGPYDLIISNPPFYENDLKGPDPKKNIAHHNEGLLLPELMQLISRLLAANGQFFLLLPFKRLDAARQMAGQHQLAFTHICSLSPKTGKAPFRVMLQGKDSGEDPVPCINSEMTITGPEDVYSPAFTDLLRDYYLYL